MSQGDKTSPEGRLSLLKLKMVRLGAPVALRSSGDETMKSVTRLILLLAWASLAFAHKVAPDLKDANPGTLVTVVIQFDSVPDNATLKAIGLKGGANKKSFREFKGGVFTVPASALADIANLPHVTYISPDRALKAKLDLSTATVGANIARQYGWTGRGIGVAVI